MSLCQHENGKCKQCGQPMQANLRRQCKPDRKPTLPKIAPSIMKRTPVRMKPVQGATVYTGRKTCCGGGDPPTPPTEAKTLQNHKRLCERDGVPTVTLTPTDAGIRVKLQMPRGQHLDAEGRRQVRCVLRGAGVGRWKTSIRCGPRQATVVAREDDADLAALSIFDIAQERAEMVRSA